MSQFRIDIDNGVARLTLSRAERHNAFDDGLIEGLTEALRTLEADTAVRVVVLAAEGRSFSAGADLDWMKRAAAAGREENLADARLLAALMRTLDTLPKTTIAAVQGPAYGGGVGLVACCDIAIASTIARFSLSEVKLGLIPSAISPYVVAAIGPRQARRWFQTAELFDAHTAHAIGLVHETVAPEALEARVAELVAALMKGAPGASREAKRLVRDVTHQAIDAALMEMTAVRIAEIRAGDEAREGIEAFLSHRPANWTLQGKVR
jgi:methylglutaconyl-CoA hydratase